MEDYEKKYELGSIVTAKRTYNGETITGEFDGFHLLDKSNPKSIVGIVHTNNGSYDVEPNSIETVINEDERIRKGIIECLEQFQFGEEPYIIDDDIVRDYIAWLEKQGVQKNTCQPNNTYGNVKFPFRARVKSSDAIITIHAGQLSMDGKEWIKYQSDVEDGYRLYKPDELELVYDVEQNQVNTVETKFKVGDWILIDNPCKIISIDDCGNYLVRYWDSDAIDKLHTLSKGFCETYFHLWTIQDAKDGDVLTTKNFIFIFSNIDYKSYVRYYCEYEISEHEKNNMFNVALHTWAMGNVDNGLSYYSPATKEQCDLLFTKMKEAGYEWDDENKELKKIEQKPCWGEEDEKILSTVIEKGDLKLSEIDWLKSLKERVQPKQKQEYGEKVVDAKV